MRKKVRRLIHVLYSIDNTYSANEKRKKLSNPELNMMYALDDGEAHSQAEISRDWLVPKTTANTIIKRWKEKGYVILEPIQGKRREMQIVFTKEGKEYANSILLALYRAEDIALQKTIECYSEQFIEALEYFNEILRTKLETETEEFT